MRKSGLREVVTCGSHTKRWHLQDFKQVCLPKSVLPPTSPLPARAEERGFRSGNEAAADLDHADSVACLSILHPVVRATAAGVSTVASSPPSLKLLSVPRISCVLGRFCSRVPGSPETPTRGAMVGKEGFWPCGVWRGCQKPEVCGQHRGWNSSLKRGSRPLAGLFFQRRRLCLGWGMGSQECMSVSAPGLGCAW